jgi:hypothetical protein
MHYPQNMPSSLQEMFYNMLAAMNEYKPAPARKCQKGKNILQQF